MIPDDPRLRRQLVSAARRAEALDLVAYAQGNLSARIPRTEYILITPTSVPYAEMRPEDIVTVDLDGRKVHGALDPSSETPVHILTYRARPGVGACIHVEPPYVNALGVIGAEIPNVLGNFVYLFGGRGLAVVPCLHSGTEGFAQASVRAMGDRFGAVWKNHGLFCVGQDIGRARVLPRARGPCGRDRAGPRGGPGRDGGDRPGPRVGPTGLTARRGGISGRTSPAERRRGGDPGRRPIGRSVYFGARGQAGTDRGGHRPRIGPGPDAGAAANW